MNVEKVMQLKTEYTFHASHWNEEFFEVEKIHQMDSFGLLRNQHGHLWRVCIVVEGDAPNGIVCDYNDFQALVRSLDFTFLPLHPLTLGHLSRKQGVSESELMLLPVWGTCGKLEVLLCAIVEKLAGMIARPGLQSLLVELHETGPEALRNVTSLSATQQIWFDVEGEPIWD